MSSLVRRMRLFSAVTLGLAMIVLPPVQPGSTEVSWESIGTGLELASFRIEKEQSSDRATLHVLRVDPRRCELSLQATSTGDLEAMTASQWCRSRQLAAATNAGMFHPDHRTHVGYMRIKEHVNSAHLNKYQSAALFGARADSLPPFRIIDLDETSLDSVAGGYDYVIQNLRLIKHRGENRWPPQEKRWIELALAEDNAGRALLLFCRSEMSMHYFNRTVLNLPLGIVAAQHLEGGPPAQLHVDYNGFEFSIDGRMETDFRTYRLPFVIGFSPRPSPPTKEKP